MKGMRIWATMIVGCALTGAASADLFSRAFGPRGPLMLRQPELQWQLRAEGGQSIATTWAKLNGATIPSRYDSDRKLVVVKLDTPLEPGSYKVEMGAEADDGLAVRKSWEFSIRNEAMQAMPVPDKDQSDVLDALNAFRRSIGEPPAVPMLPMHAAAEFHARYLSTNNANGHIQQPGTPSFFGSTPTERLNAFGFIDNNYEVVHYGPAKHERAIANLVAAPYHRIPFLTPGAIEAGTGYENERLVILFGMNKEVKTMIYPADGQKDVPTLWDQRERPNPLRIHPGLQQPVGYPIMLSHFSPQEVRLTLTSVTLVHELTGQTVDIAINHPGNDGELSSTVFIMPRQPLLPNSAYRVSFQVKSEDEKDHSRTWVFHTGAR